MAFYPPSVVVAASVVVAVSAGTSPSFTFVFANKCYDLNFFMWNFL